MICRLLFVLHHLGGERGIRTPGPITVNSFQDCRIRPLCQLSAAKVQTLFIFANCKVLFFKLFNLSRKKDGWSRLFNSF